MLVKFHHFSHKPGWNISKHLKKPTSNWMKIFDLKHPEAGIQGLILVRWHAEIYKSIHEGCPCTSDGVDIEWLAFTSGSHVIPMVGKYCGKMVDVAYRTPKKRRNSSHLWKAVHGFWSYSNGFLRSQEGQSNPGGLWAVSHGRLLDSKIPKYITYVSN